MTSDDLQPSPQSFREGMEVVIMYELFLVADYASSLWKNWENKFEKFIISQQFMASDLLTLMEAIDE